MASSDDLNNTKTQETECQGSSNSEILENQVRNCAYFLPKKHRLCRFPAAKNGQYCGAHAHLDQDDVDGRKRVPCPYDPNHTVFVDKMEKHKKRCNSRPSYNKVYENEHVNAGDRASLSEEGDKEIHGATEVKGLSKYSDEEIVTVIRKVIHAFNCLPKEARNFSYSIELPENNHAAESHLTRSTRNLLQQAALTNLLFNHCLNGLNSLQKQNEIFENETAKKARLEDNPSTTLSQDDVTFVEFGAGGGGWSHYLWTKIGISSSTQTSLPHNGKENSPVASYSESTNDERQITSLKQAKFLLIDRQSVRNKYDKRGICLSQPEGCQISRIRVDIEHLMLHQAPLIASQPSTEEASRINSGVLVAISKHLCGDATDLTLRCLINYVKQGSLQESCSPTNVMPSLKGVVIALCCHHRCTLSQYCNWNWLKNSPCVDTPNNLSLAFEEKEFPILARLTGWATCFGVDIVKESLRSHGPEQANDEDERIVSPTLSQSFTQILDGLTAPYKSSIGRKAKRLLDWGRIAFFKEKMALETRSLSLATPRLISYCDPSVTLENIAFLYAS